MKTETPAKSSPLRLVILLLIFGIALTGLLYDYCIARPAWKVAYDDIQGLLEGRVPDPNEDGTVTDDEVESVLGRKPSTIEHLSNGKIDIYTWRSGFPLKTHKLYVIFSGKRHPLLHGATTTKPSPVDLPPKALYKKDLTEEEVKNFKPSKPMSAGAGGPSSGSKGGRGGGRGRGGEAGQSRGKSVPPDTESGAETKTEPDQQADSEAADTDTADADESEANEPAREASQKEQSDGNTGADKEGSGQQAQ